MKSDQNAIKRAVCLKREGQDTKPGRKIVIGKQALHYDTLNNRDFNKHFTMYTHCIVLCLFVYVRLDN